MLETINTQYRFLFPEQRLKDLKEILEDMISSGKEYDSKITSLVCFFIFDVKLMKSQERFLTEVIKLKTNTSEPNTVDVWQLVNSLLTNTWQSDYDIVQIGKKHGFII